MTVNAGFIGWSVYGGYSEKQDATGNSVIINGGTIKKDIYGGASKQQYATGNNIVIINAGIIEGSVYGGHSEKQDATGNSVIINGGCIGKNVYGGKSKNGVTTNNIVNYAGGTVHGKIIGGDSDNTLNIQGTNLSASNVFDFQNLNFYIPADAVSGATLLTLTSTTQNTDLRNMQVKAGVTGGSKLQTGDTIILLKKKAQKTF